MRLVIPFRTHTCAGRAAVDLVPDDQGVSQDLAEAFVTGWSDEGQGAFNAVEGEDHTFVRPHSEHAAFGTSTSHTSDHVSRDLPIKEFQWSTRSSEHHAGRMI